MWENHFFGPWLGTLYWMAPEIIKGEKPSSLFSDR
jgi:hypothetical protein